MTRSGRDEDGGGDLIEFGGGRKRRGRVWLGVVAVAVVAVIVVMHHGGAPRSEPPTAVTGPIGGGSATADASTGPAMPLTALGVTSRWQIIARGPASVLDITPSTGQVVMAAAPGLNSTGPINFLAGPDWTLVLPLDPVPGYVDRDGVPIASVANAGGYAIAGPTPSEYWTASQESKSTTMTFHLTDIQSRSIGPVISGISPSSSLSSDLAGNILERRADGFYDHTPTSTKLITKGQLAAAGRTRWLVWECVEPSSCQAIVINRVTGTRHVLPAFRLAVDDIIGSISPDGTTAAVYAKGPDGMDQVHLVDLYLGADVSVQALLPDPVVPSSIAWSPEGAWLFLVDRAGDIEAVNGSTAVASPLDLGLQPVAQLLIRPAPLATAARSDAGPGRDAPDPAYGSAGQPSPPQRALVRSWAHFW